MRECRYTTQGATIDASGRYRYALWRTWDLDKPLVRWILLNPSTADGDTDDPTIRRCVGFARTWGYGGIIVLNLYAYRATDPHDLTVAGDEAVGPENDSSIIGGVTCEDVVVCGWGAHPFATMRARRVLALLDGAWVIPQCLGVTKDGSPRHPLYLRGDLHPEPLGLVVRHA